MASSPVELKETIIVACDTTLQALAEIKTDLEEILAFQMVDERTKLLTSVVLECRQIMDVWPSRQGDTFTPSKKASGSSPLSKLAQSLELYLWDIAGRVTNLRDWGMQTENQEELLNMMYDLRHLSWLVKAYQDYDIITSNQMAAETDTIGELSNDIAAKEKEKEKEKKAKKKLTNFLSGVSGVVLGKKDNKEGAPPLVPHIPFTEAGAADSVLEVTNFTQVFSFSGAPSARNLTSPRGDPKGSTASGSPEGKKKDEKQAVASGTPEERNKKLSSAF